MLSRRSLSFPAAISTAALLVILAMTLLAACGSDSGVDAPETTEPAAAQPTLRPFLDGGPATFNVIAGGIDGPVDIEQFMPQTVRIRAGDTIHWAGRGYEGHTVTFFPSGIIDIGVGDYVIPAPDREDTLEFNPRVALASDVQGSYDGSEFVNSGFFGVPSPGDYELTFPESGVFPYVCMVHPLHMRGVVIVEEAGTEVASPEVVLAEGKGLLSGYAAEAREEASVVASYRGIVAEETGGRVWEVSAGVDTAQSQVLSFLPAALEIETGDTVLFWNSDRDFHNVIFTPEGEEAPQFPILEFPEDGRGGFRLLIDPDAEREIPPPESGPSPDALFSSGMMGLIWPRNYYEVTFTQPGSYRYFCTVHTLAGMAGVIDVLPETDG